MPDIIPGVESNLAKDLVTNYQQAKRVRMPNESDWRTVAELGLPRHYGGWVTTGAPQNAGTGAARQSRIRTYDSTLARALRIYGAVIERVMTPASQMYHMLMPENSKYLKQRSVVLGLERLNEELFTRRYQAPTRFSAAQSATYISGGAYGNAGKMVTWRKANKQRGTKSGFLYRNIPFRNLFWDVDDDEQICTKYRRIDWTAKQAAINLGEKCPQKLKDVLKQPTADQTRTWEFFQCITAQGDYDEYALDYRRMPLASYYVFVDEPCIVNEGAGYSSDPLMISRAETEGGSPYGYGDAQVMLSTVGVLNAQKKTWLRQGQLALQPPLLTRDDGVMNGTVDQTPGASNPGGVNSQGQKMVHALEPGNFTIVEKMIAAEQDDVKEVLFGKIFEIVKDRPQMTATQVLDEAAKEGAILAPTMSRWQSDDLGPTIEREILLLAENNALPEGLPTELSHLDYKPVYTSPLAKAQHSESVSGFMRIAEMTMNFAKMTGDNRPVRRLNLDVALPEIAAQQSVPARWVKTDDEMAASDAKAQQQQETDQAIAVAPAAASVAKAVMDKGGVPAMPQ